MSLIELCDAHDGGRSISRARPDERMSVAHKILIVDDEVHIRTLLEQTLEDLEDQGVEILVAADGAEGLKLIEAEKPDLVFLDVMMPKMSGYDVCKTVKQDLAMTDIQIVMLTAKGQAADRQEALDAGADVFTTKPFDPDEIVEIAVGALGLEA